MRDALRRAALLLVPLVAFACGGDSGGSSGDGGNPPGDGNPPADPVGPDAVATEFLQAHNVVRKAAQPAPSPPLPLLTWSSAAAAAAKTRADECTFGSPGPGENLSSSPLGATPSSVVQGWATQAAGYDHAANTCASPPLCTYYTQLVARVTTSVGCAMTTCATGNPIGTGPWDLWVCLYEPPADPSARPY